MNKPLSASRRAGAGASIVLLALAAALSGCNKRPPDTPPTPTTSNSPMTSPTPSTSTAPAGSMSPSASAVDPMASAASR